MFAPPTFVKTSSGWSPEPQRLSRDARWRSSRTCSPGVPPGRLQDNPHGCGVSSVAALTGERRGNAYRLPSRPPPFHLRVCDVSVALAGPVPRGCGLRWPRGRLRDRHRVCGVSVAWPVRCPGGCRLRFPSGRSGATEVEVSDCLADIFGTVVVAAASRSPGQSGAIEVVVSGCLADVLGTIV